MPENPRPFAGRKLTRRERRASDKRARERADRMARAMPPPAQVDQVDPITGQPLYTPGAPAAPTVPTGGAVPAGLTPSPAVMPPATASTPAPVPAPAPTTLPAGASNPFAPLPAQAATVTPHAPAPSSAQGSFPGAEHAAGSTRPSLWGRLTAPVPEPRSRWHLLLGAVLTSAGFCTTAAFTVPVVAPERDWAIAGVAAIGLLVGAVLLRSGWHQGSTRMRVSGAALTVLAMTGFVVGAVADPIVLDGQVLVETSTRAKAVRLADSIYDDLNRIAGYDDMLVAPIEDARAHVSEYDPATKDLLRISKRYADMTEDDLPDPAFANVVAQMKTTAFWAAEAMETKTGLIEQDDARAQEDLATQRASFTDNWLAAAASLKEVASGLDIPYTTDMEGPHE